jgi:multiple sugar transport system permease protein
VRQFNTESPLSGPIWPTLVGYRGLADAGFGRAIVVTALMTAVILLGRLVFSVVSQWNNFLWRSSSPAAANGRC